MSESRSGAIVLVEPKDLREPSVELSDVAVVIVDGAGRVGPDRHWMVSVLNGLDATSVGIIGAGGLTAECASVVFACDLVVASPLAEVEADDVVVDAWRRAANPTRLHSLTPGIVAVDVLAEAGLISELAGEPRQAAVEIARELAGKSLLAARHVRTLTRVAGSISLADMHRREAAAQTECLGSAAHREAMAGR